MGLTYLHGFGYPPPSVTRCITRDCALHSISRGIACSFILLLCVYRYTSLSTEHCTNKNNICTNQNHHHLKPLQAPLWVFAKGMATPGVCHPQGPHVSHPQSGEGVDQRSAVPGTAPWAQDMPSPSAKTHNGIFGYRSPEMRAIPRARATDLVYRRSSCTPPPPPRTRPCDRRAPPVARSTRRSATPAPRADVAHRTRTARPEDWTGRARHRRPTQCQCPGAGFARAHAAPPPPPPCVTFRRVVAPLRGPGQSPVLPFACCVGSLRSVGRCGRCSCWCRFRVREAPSLVCRGCAGCAPPPPRVRSCVGYAL